MLNVKVALSSFSAERFWDSEKQLPPNLQIAVNINLAEFSGKGEDSAEVPFILTINYVPSVGQLMSKGRVYLSGDRKAINDMREGLKKNQLPAVVVQAIWTATLGELAVISKSMGLPPPLPPVGLPQTAGGPPAGSQNLTV
jgi:hypothetical protein